MKKTAAILINRDNTPIKVVENSKTVEFHCADFAGSFCVYPINMQRIVCGGIRTAKTVAECWEVAYQMFDDYKAGGIDFADNYELSKG